MIMTLNILVIHNIDQLQAHKFILTRHIHNGSHSLERVDGGRGWAVFRKCSLDVCTIEDYTKSWWVYYRGGVLRVPCYFIFVGYMLTLCLSALAQEFLTQFCAAYLY